MVVLKDTLSTDDLDEPAGDMIDMIELIMGCEETFDIEIPDEYCDDFKTPRQVLNYLRKRFAYAKKEQV
jgi:acyl carrier protein